MGPDEIKTMDINWWLVQIRVYMRDKGEMGGVFFSGSNEWWKSQGAKWEWEGKDKKVALAASNAIGVSLFF